MSNNKIKIFVTYKEKHRIIESDIITPIQTGRAISDEIFEEMIGDDTGDNISKDNDRYCELTAQYWAWKNYDKIGNPEYVGFMHYRRHFMLNEPLILPKHNWLNKMPVYMFDIIDDNYLKMFDDESIKNYCNKYDCIVLKPYDLRNYKPENTIKKQVSNIIQQHERIFDLFIETLKEEAPEFKEEISKMEFAHEQYLCNMFIMKKDLFFEYSEFAFRILKKLDEKIDFHKYSEQEMRFQGYLGEILLTLYLWNLKKRNIKIAEVRGSRIINGDFYFPEKVYENSNTAIATIATEETLAQLTVTLNSIIENTVFSKKYDIVILETGIEKKLKELLLAQYKDVENVSIRFLNITNYLNYRFSKYVDFKNYDLHFIKIFLCDIFKNYEKIIFASDNLIFKTDILLLEGINIVNKSILCCQDFSRLMSEDNATKEGIEYRENFISTELFVFNINKMINDNFSNNCIDMLINRDFEISFDELLMNSVSLNDLEFLPQNWNITALYLNPYKSRIPLWVKKDYLKVRQSPCVYNYSLLDKPWLVDDFELYVQWWNEAKKTVFYEKLLFSYLGVNKFQTKNFVNCQDKNLREEFTNVHFPNINKHFENNEYQIKCMFVASRLFFFQCKKIYYKIKLNFLSGNKKKLYKNKYIKIKQLLKDAKKLKKEFKRI